MQVRLVRATGEDDFVGDAEGSGREIDRSPMVSDTYVRELRFLKFRTLTWKVRWMTFQTETDGFARPSAGS